MILRTWRGWVAADRADAYVQYVEQTGLAEYRAIEGNQGDDEFRIDGETTVHHYVVRGS